MASPASAPRVVVYEGPGARPLDDRRRFETMAALLDGGYAVTRPAQGGQVSEAGESTLMVVGEFEQDLQNDDSVTVKDIEGLEPEAIVDQVRSVQEARGQEQPGQWKPWFPVIDYDRCTNCMQCLSFCLFDVYGVDTQKQIQVQNQDKCKTNCPACSRVCPEAAILFPKYSKGPINGDVVRDEDVQKQSMKVDISALLGGDIYSSLKSRHKEARSRFSTERDESKALLERKRCLKKLKAELDIPDEVLMSLPSAGDIEERARRAKEKMEKRMARSQTVKDQRAAPTEEDWGI